MPTLRTISGMSNQPAALSDSALILIDCQNTYRHGVMQLTGVEPALVEASKILFRARDAGRPIIHIRHDAGPDTPYDVRTEIGQIAEPVAPLGGERVITKNYPNSFVQTGLDDALKTLDAKNLILVGFMTHMCVNSTARGAFNLGYASTVIASAAATRDLPAPDGGTVPADVLHRTSLAAINDLFGVVVQGVDDIPA